MGMGKLMIVDGNSIINRAFYGLQGPHLLATSEGLYTNAVYGFINIVYKYIEEEKPDYLCVAFDLKAPTFRHKEYSGYKAKRKGMPDELAVQVPVLKEVLDAMNIKRLEYEGYEADDIIGSVSLCAEKEGMEVIIITGDRDALQLAGERTRIKIPSTRGGRTITKEFDYEKVVETYGVTPVQLIDVKGLMGDQSDNIPGIKGIGEKTALSLINEYGSIHNIYKNIESVKKKGIREKLEAEKQAALMSKRLAKIERNMPHLCHIHELKRSDFDKEKLFYLFKKLEFNTFIEKFELVENGNCINEQKEVDYVDSMQKLKSIKESIRKKGSFSIYCMIDKDRGFAGLLAGVAVSWSDEKSAYIDINKKLDEKVFLTEFRDILENKDIKKSGHAIKNFIVYLKSKSIELRGLDFDTMIAAYIINPSRSTYRLSDLSSEYLEKRFTAIEDLSGKGKNFRPFREIPVEEIAQICVLHVEAITCIENKLKEVLAKNNQHELYYDIELPLVEVLADMEYRGFKVNIDELRAFSAELEKRIDSLTEQIYDIAGEEFNINSPKQLGVVLFEKLGLPVLKKTKTGYSTNAEVLEQLLPKHEIVSYVIEYRQLVKLKSTYAEGLISVIDHSTGRIHSSFNQTVTATGRISSTEPNLQNIPVKLDMGRSIRKVFVSESDSYVLVDADYSQIELRVLAHITEDENMISAFRDNEDIHTTTAQRVFGTEKKEVTPLMRSRAKAVNFGIIYGIGDFSLSKDIGVTRKEARKYIDEYLEKYPKVKKYMHDIVEEGKKYGYVTTMFNRRRYLPELSSKNFILRSFGERIAMNTPIQGSAADIIKIAMVRVYKELAERKMKSRLILQVHDELIIETFLNEKEQVIEILKNCMENAVKLRVPLNIDVKAGKTWYETK